MKLDRSREWRIFLAAPECAEGYLASPTLASRIAKPELCPSPASFAAAELAGALATAGVKAGAGIGNEDASFGIIMLDSSFASSGAENESGGRRGFAWRASETRIEIHGESEAGLLAGAYDLLDKAGFRWLRPGESASVGPDGEAELEFAASSGRKENGAILPLLILGHGSYLEKAADYMLWGARNGYGGVFFHTTGEKLALGAAPIGLYDSLRGELADLARRLGLGLELGGHGLSALLPRKLIKKEPELFRMADGIRTADQNFCPSNPKGIGIVGRNFSAFAAAHPEISVFHVWPDDLPGGGWCSCPACSGLSPAAQSLRVAANLAAVLEKARPGARLSFLAYHDTEDMAGAVQSLGGKVPANLELLWAPRMRSWAAGYGDPASALNESSRANFEAARAAFLAAGGGSVSIFEYWEDAILFKTAVPPLAACMEGDLAYYAEGKRADKVGVLLTGDRLPLAARPNLWLMPRLLGGQVSGEGQVGAGRGAEALWAAWCASAYGPAAAPMRRYWAALEAAWAIDLDLEPGETAINIPAPITTAGKNPPADWGDPWLASAERLGTRRARCEEAFTLLREAEAAMAEARASFAPAGDRSRAESRAGKAVEDEALEYAISSGIIELDSARLSAYHEAAQGEAGAAADIAVIALSILDGLYRSFRAIPDARARRNAAFILYLNYGLRLRAIARAPRNALRRKCGETAAFLGLARRALGLAGAWDARAGKRELRGRNSRTIL
jgi:hypothetical protein